MRVGLLLAATVLVLLGSVALADPYKLKCTDADGSPGGDITVDLDRHIVTWGSLSYAISGLTDRYLTAVEKPSDFYEGVGGEVLVLDRVSGAFKRAGVLMLCTLNKDCPVMTLRARIFEGRCTKPMF